MKTPITIVGSLMLLLVCSPQAFAANCCVDSQCVYSTTLNTSGAPFFGTLCGTHTVSGSGGTCTIVLSADESVSSGNCVTFTDRATLDLNGHTIDCSGSCGTAFDDTDTTTANPVRLQNGNITGCWTNAATAQSDTYGSTITDVFITLAGGCGTNGVGPYKTITRLSVGEAAGTAVDAGITTSIVDSIIHNSTVGVKVRGSGAAGTDIRGSLIYNSLTNIQTMTSVNGSGGPQTLTDSTVLAAPCNFKDVGGTCGPAVNVIQMTGTNFEDRFVGGNLIYEIIH